MFEEFIREIRRLERPVTVRIDLPLDEKGYLDRSCSHRECRCDFKVLYEDWRDKVPDKEAWCPKCGNRAERASFNTKWQEKHIAEVGRAHMAERLNQALSRAARRTRPKTISAGLFGITMSVKHKAGRVPLVLTPAADAALRQDFTCDRCGCRYSTIGAGYFCPACGDNSPLRDFDRTIEMARKTIAGMQALTEAFEKVHEADSAADFQQQLLEDQVENLITAFQRCVEALFAQLPGAASHKKDANLFQRLDDGSALWKIASGKSYEDLIDAAEMKHLRMMIQRRHKIGHSQAMVDSKYVEQSGDTSYEIGQRLVVAERQVARLADILEKLIAALKTAVTDAKVSNQ